MANNTGAGLIGWALFAGAPATLTAFAAHPALGLTAGFVTVAAWRIGCLIEEKESERVRREWEEHRASEAATKARREAEARQVALAAHQAAAVAAKAEADEEAAYYASRPKVYGGEAFEQFLGGEAQFEHPVNFRLLQLALEEFIFLTEEDDLRNWELIADAAKAMPGYLVDPPGGAARTSQAELDAMVWTGTVARFLASNPEFRDPANLALLQDRFQARRGAHPTACSSALLGPAGVDARQMAGFRPGAGCGT